MWMVGWLDKRGLFGGVGDQPSTRNAQAMLHRICLYHRSSSQLSTEWVSQAAQLDIVTVDKRSGLPAVKAAAASSEISTPGVLGWKRAVEHQRRDVTRPQCRRWRANLGFHTPTPHEALLGVASVTPRACLGSTATAFAHQLPWIDVDEARRGPEHKEAGQRLVSLADANVLYSLSRYLYLVLGGVYVDRVDGAAGDRWRVEANDFQQALLAFSRMNGGSPSWTSRSRRSGKRQAGQERMMVKPR